MLCAKLLKAKSFICLKMQIPARPCPTGIISVLNEEEA